MTSRERAYAQPFDLDEFYASMERMETAEHNLKARLEAEDSDQARAKAFDLREAVAVANANAAFYASEVEF